jgi:hypothetical protein
MHSPSPSAPTSRSSNLQPSAFIPPARIGLVQLPGSTRLVWWTGRVAIGLRYWPARQGRTATD